jgi:hypothetical protein
MGDLITHWILNDFRLNIQTVVNGKIPREEKMSFNPVKLLCKER